MLLHRWQVATIFDARRNDFARVIAHDGILANGHFGNNAQSLAWNVLQLEMRRQRLTGGCVHGYHNVNVNVNVDNVFFFFFLFVIVTVTIRRRRTFPQSRQRQRQRGRGRGG